MSGDNFSELLFSEQTSKLPFSGQTSKLPFSGQTSKLPFSGQKVEPAAIPRGWDRVDVNADGNCLFRALSLAMYGSENEHGSLRLRVVDNIFENWDFYESFIVGNTFGGVLVTDKYEYNNLMAQNGTHGGHIELTAATNIFNKKITVFNSTNNTFIPIGSNTLKRKEIFLFYEGDGENGHYSVLIKRKRKLGTRNQATKNKKVNKEPNGGDVLSIDVGRFNNQQIPKERMYLGENFRDHTPPLLIGMPSIPCKHCGALTFKTESGRNKTSCCHNGKIKIDPLPQFPEALKTLFVGTNEESRHFRSNIRFYNNSFAMASFCPAEDVAVPGMSCLKIRGELNVRATTSLIPKEGHKPLFAQIYIYDKDTALSFRTSDQCRGSLIKIIQEIMNDNPYARVFKTLFQLYKEKNYDNEVKLQFFRLKGDDRRRYNQPTEGLAEVAAIVVTGSEGVIPYDIDFVAYPKHQFESKIIHKLSCHNEPMLFPLLFPKGTPGYSVDMVNKNAPNQRRVTALQYFSQRLAIHYDVFNPILCGGRLTQQYVIYGYIVVEWNRINYIKTHQQLFRRETFQGLADHVRNSTANTSDKVRLGNAVVLPSTFIGGPRAMQQLYQDSMALARELGRPDLFVTFTANPKWPEIKEYLKTMPSGTNASDIPYFIVRSFNTRFKTFIQEIYSGKVFGEIMGYVYTIEFQKRGLPHAHCLFILNPRDKLLTPESLDRFISAEIPDKKFFPELYKKVMRHMLHGPHTDKTQCWDSSTGTCSKKFPFPFISDTNMMGDSFPRYKRRDNRVDLHTYNQRVDKRAIPVDNSMVVPYNPYLILKYDCHINTEYCGSLMAIKYIHKYITKGHDRIKVGFRDNTNPEQDEIKDYIDSRYVSSMESAWRLLEIPMHGQSHTIIRLPVHLPGQQYITFSEGNEANAISGKKDITMLTAYFKLNQFDCKARELFYEDIPKYYTWNNTERSWNKRRQKCRVVTRLYTVSPKDPERFFLKVLCRQIKGATSFRDLKTFNDVVYETFKEAAFARGLGSDDNYLYQIMQEAVTTMMPPNLRAFFSYLLLTCELANGKDLWEKFKYFLCQGISEKEALVEIESRLKGEEKSLNHFGIDLKVEYIDILENALDDQDHKQIYEQMIYQLNDDQKAIFTDITSAISVPNQANKLFFIDGPGGTGKTFLYKCLFHYLKYQKKKIICVAWTGIAAILLPGGKTAHRVFKLPLQMSLDGNVGPVHLSREAKRVLTDVDLVIWDEASMIPSIALSIIDLTLKDVMKNKCPFGGKFLLLGGDFRQVLPIVKKGSRHQIVQASLKSSPLWLLFKRFQLIKNMRTDNESFSKWLLTIGNGEVDQLKVPSVNLCQENLINIMCDINMTEEYLKSSILLALRNSEVNMLNNEVLNKLPGAEVVCEGYSWASAVDSDNTDEEDVMLKYQPEFLASLCPSGLPPHRLHLKVGAIVMLIRNICISDGLCNGTRLIVKKIQKSIIFCSILTGDKQGTIVTIPRIILNTKGENELPFILNRKQFPVRLAFAMTINKCQGQSFDRVGLYIDQNKPIFGHGQLYVALSRCRSMEGIKIKIVGGKNDEEKHNIKNLVFKEVLD